MSAALAAVAIALGCASSASLAANAVNGKQIYENGKSGTPACSMCHGLDPSSVRRGSDWTVIQSAITRNLGGMGLYSTVLTNTDLQDIAAYIANPAAGTPSPFAAIAPAALAFGNQTQSIPSAPLTATLTNSGTANLTLGNITIGGANAADFTRAGTCAVNLVLAAGQSCTIDVVFTPLAIGTRVASISIAHNATGSPTSLALSGTGVASTPVAPAITLAPSALDFGTIAVGTTSAAKVVQLTNSGNAALEMTGIAVTGASASDFAATTTCTVPGSLAAGASCSISVTFSPSLSGVRMAELAIASNALGAPTVTLRGSGASTTPSPGPSGTLELSTTAMDFGSVAVGRTGRAQSLKIANTGSGTVTISSIDLTGDFLQKASCAGRTLEPGGVCLVRVQFRPSDLGSRTGQLTIASDAAGGPYAVTLSGVGVSGKPSRGRSVDGCETEDDESSTCSAVAAPLGGASRSATGTR